MNIRRFLWLLAAIVVIAVIARSVYWMATPGVRVFITNAGPTGLGESDVLRDVTIRAAGTTYDLGDLLLGETKQVHVCSAAETFMVIEYTDKRGKRIRTREEYLQSNRRGEVRITLKDDEFDSLSCVVSIMYQFLP